ncbi:hypothetical protein BJ138DRAFT_1105943 [Hygrophoropsis aurantiaca]|uniref:Uncharacterized protein n=1 Tax=Hygrophoropsis aurantiaca TaxID=72124 RepID=A0ACB7ZX80_9AGAM|nr:hypothetical protein BJ138DRAFT_1105943 [Hygrophoropsis aurantiaca]
MTTRRANHDDPATPPSKRLKENPSKALSADTSDDSNSSNAKDGRQNDGATSSSKTLTRESPSDVTVSPEPPIDSNSANEANSQDLLSSSPHLVAFDDNVKRRVKICETYSSVEKLIFSINRMPNNVSWGSNKPFKNLSDVLCGGATADKIPATFWIVGQATSVYYMKSSTEYADQMSIRILPSTPGSGKKVSDLLTKLSSAPATTADDSGWGVLRVSAWQSKFVNGAKAEPTPFESVFDARDGYGEKDSMPTLSLRDIKPRDVILVETYIKRYFTDRREKWRAFLHLKAVSLIATAPELPEEKKEEESSPISF